MKKDIMLPVKGYTTIPVFC